MPVSHSINAAASAPKVTFAPETPSMDNVLSLRGHRKRASDSNNILAAANSPMKRSISTPVISSPAMISSEQVADFEKQRQSLVMMTTYIASSIQEKRRGDPIKFEELIAQLTVTKPSPLSPAKMLQWIQALSQCISLLDKSCVDLIEAMLQIDWLIQEDVFVQYYMSFLGNVVSAHAFYVVPVQSMLVQKLTHRYKPTLTGDTPVISREVQHERVHQALKYILGLIPTGATSLFPLLAHEFPHKRESIYAHTVYVKNILRVLEYAPVLRTQILGLVIERIIQVDVEIQVELEELEDSDTEVAYDFDSADDDDEEDISDDSDSDSDDDSDSGSDSDGVQVAVMDIKKMTKKLDGMLFLVFSYLEGYVNSCRHLPTPNGRMPAPVEELFLVLLQIFMGTILQTFKSRHTQFILFYIVSLSPQFSDYFLGALGTKILDKSQPEVIRVSAAAYMSSFVSRAKYLDIRQVLMVIDMLGNFVLELVAKVDTGSNVLPDADRYAVFYAVVQALMYIFCFRWRVLEVGAENKIRSSKDDFDSAGMIVGSMDSPDVNSSRGGVGRQWHSGLNSLQRVVTSRLNPLKMCSSNVVKQFARISQSLDFMYIYPILEQNKKIYIPRHAARPDSDMLGAGSGNRNGAGANGSGNPTVGGQLPHELETFFPFDPYRLRRSAPFMQGIYQEWESEEDDEDDEDEDDYDEDDAGEEEYEDDEDDELQDIGRHNASMNSEDEEDEDDDEAEMNKSIMAMSISPSPAHFLVQGMTGRK
ncbi:hypothetical protein BGZ96_006513 [Linnemannia gamsii]|uniref:RNA polymerase I-specific transcription initiation factor RRN3 n=1 Tax=Linnemannia gamsii TaxID=64522 RepID=A0ABQ7K3I7_9FUNG|nr:hypothetical protein BGZ96_006513 [Linnemannia gamsii]